MTEYESTAQQMWREAGMDIVNQLKEFRYYRRLDSNGTPIMLHPGICDDAADEIERLREEYADLEFCLEQTREKLHGEIERLRAERDTWHKACAVLYGECREGGSRGRPMDRIPKRAWATIVQLIAAAEGGE